MKPIRTRKIRQMSTHDLKSYAHDQAKRAKRLRDEMARLGNRAAAAERAEKRARLELAERDAMLINSFTSTEPAGISLTGIPVSHHVV